MGRRHHKRSAGPIRISYIMAKNFMGLFLRKVFGRRSRDFPAKFRNSLEELGPTYIKLGQMLSTRYDMFSKETIKELSKLQDEVHPVPYVRIEKEMERSYGNLNKIFSHIQKKPLASASIAQVHLGRLVNGEKVAIKIRRPDLDRIITKDINTLTRIARFIDRFVFFIHDDITGLVEEFGISVRDEMDFLSEMKAIIRFQNNFSNSDIIKAPKPYREICRENVLVMEYIPGVKLSKVMSGGYDREKYPIKKENLIEVLGNAMLEQIFIHGFLHADPHPGNLIITREGELYFIDFGRVNYLDDDMQTFLLEYMISIAKKDPDMMAEIISDNFGLKNRDSYSDEIRYLFSKYYGKSLDRINFGELMVDSFMVSRKHQVKLPPQIFLMSRVIILIEGIGTVIDPKFDYVRFLRDYFTKRRITDVLKDRFNEVKEDTIWNMVMLPRKMRNLDRLIMGNRKLQFKLPLVEKQLKNFVRAINALAVAVIMAGLLVSVNKFKYPLIPQLFLMALGMIIIYQIFFKPRD